MSIYIRVCLIVKSFYSCISLCVVHFGGFADICGTNVTTNILTSLDRKRNHNEPMCVTTIVSSYIKIGGCRNI